ncbi:MAG: 6-phosphogluconolactonase [Planctomycetales bacterium]
MNIKPQDVRDKAQDPTGLSIGQFADAEAMIAAAADEVVSSSQKTAGRFRFVLSGGSTPRDLYQLLASEPFSHQIDWSNVDFFWGDERSVPPDHVESNYRMVKETLLDPLNIPQCQIHRIVAENPNLADAAADYQRQIAAAFNSTVDGSPPSFDLVLLGMGGDGHTASLFPHTTALSETSKWVVENHVPQLSTDRITMTVPLICHARQVLFLVAGTDKADRLAEVLEGPRESDRLPSQLIQPLDGTVTWLVDAAAASKLQ